MLQACVSSATHQTLDSWVASLLETAPPPSAEVLALLGFPAPADAASAA